MKNSRKSTSLINAILWIEADHLYYCYCDRENNHRLSSKSICVYGLCVTKDK